MLKYDGQSQHETLFSYCCTTASSQMQQPNKLICQPIILQGQEPGNGLVGFPASGSQFHNPGVSRDYNLSRSLTGRRHISKPTQVIGRIHSLFIKDLRIPVPGSCWFGGCLQYPEASIMLCYVSCFIVAVYFIKPARKEVSLEDGCQMIM